MEIIVNKVCGGYSQIIPGEPDVLGSLFYVKSRITIDTMIFMDHQGSYDIIDSSHLIFGHFKICTL